MSQAEWRRTPTGGLRREEVLADGMKRTEHYSPASATTTYRDIWPDAVRITREYGPASTPIVQFLQDKFKTIRHPQVNFWNKEKGSLIGITIQEQDKLLVNLTMSNLNEEIVELDNVNALLSISYVDNKLVDCSMQAERLLGHNDEDAFSESKGWKELLPTFLNLRRTTPSENSKLEKEVSVNSYERFILANFENHNDPIIQEAQAISSQLIEHMLGSVAPEGRIEALRLLQDYDWQNILAIGLLQEYKTNGRTIRSVIEEIGEDAFLDDFIRNDIRGDFVQANLFIFQNLLKLTNVSANGFEWREIEIEESETGNITVEKNNGFEIFGSEVLVQDHKFRIERDNGNINVACLSLKDNRVWSASFPVNLPTSDIAAIGSNRDADFRDIKPLLEGISLET